MFVLAGYLLGENWHLVEEYMGIVSKVVVAAVVLVVVRFAAVRLRERRGQGPHAR